MKLIANQFYHIYNQGNNQETIFLERNDYLRFLTKYRFLVAPNCDTIAYCLMPNHFHFLVGVTEKSEEQVRLGGIEVDRVTDGFRKLLSEYAQEFNKKYHRSGSLFRQKTKGKLLSDNSGDYATTCFHYIHQNPYRAQLIKNMEDWEFSSFRDYIQLRNGTLCKKEIASLYFELSASNFYEESYQVIPDSVVEKLF